MMPLSLSFFFSPHPPKLRHFLPETPIFLVGSKSDLRGQATGRDFVGPSEAVEVARRHSLVGYHEISSLSDSGVRECFQETVRTAISGINATKTAKASARRRSKTWRGRLNSGDGHKPKPKPVPPTLPPAGRAPVVLPMNATLSRDLGRALALQSTAAASVAPDYDVRIELATMEGGSSWFTLMAHKCVLLCACPKIEEMLSAPIAVHDLSPRRIEQVGTPENCCTICLDNEATHLVVPCGHQCGCEECLLDVQQASGQCPICRAMITSIQRVYNVASPASPAADSPVDQHSGDMQPPAPIVGLRGVASLRLTGSTPRALRTLLRWLYTGQADTLPNSSPEVPNRLLHSATQTNRKFSKDDLAFLNEVHSISEPFGADELQSYITNIKSGDSWLNPSFATVERE